mgnify:CR=1 FL=1
MVVPPGEHTASFSAPGWSPDIVPVTENGDIIMVRQYRNAPERYTLEIPAGGLNAGEDRKTMPETLYEKRTASMTESP